VTRRGHVPQEIAEAIAALRGTRLGRLERELLLAAAPNGHASGTPIVAASGSAGVARRRALASLRAKGLVEIGRAVRVADPELLADAGGRAYLRVRHAWRSTLGEWIVDAYARELERGLPIRWDSRGPEAQR
jgi:hypothetical protein